MGSRIAFLAGILFVIGSVSAEAQYSVLVDFDDIHIGDQYNLLGVHAFDGDTLYAIVRGIESNVTPVWETQIIRVDDYLGTPIKTELVTDAEWKAYTGNGDFDTILPSARMLVIDGYLQFIDSATDAIYRVDTTTGALSTFVSNADLQAYTGLTQARVLDAVAISPWNDMTFYDQDSDMVISVDPNGVLTTVLDPNDFTDLYGSLPINAVAGGMTYDQRGVLYWSLSAGSTTGSAGGSIYKLECDGTTSRVLAQENIWDITLAFANVGFNDIYYAADGNLYFYDRASDGILNFDPNDPRLPWPTEDIMPADLLFQYQTESELMGGPMGTDYVSGFVGYGSDLSWYGLTADSPDVYIDALAGPVIADSDYNRDTFVNELDLDLFLDDYTAPDVAYDPNMSAEPPDCRGFLPTDLDEDGDVDLHDLPPLQLEYTGN